MKIYRKSKTIKICIMLSLVMFLYAFSFCASTQNLGRDVRTKIYTKSYENVFDAVLESCQEYGYFIKNIDRDSGIIDTDYRTGGFWESLFAGGSFRSKIGVNITQLADSGTRVYLTIVREERDGLSGWNSQLRTKGNAEKRYSQLFNIIDEKMKTGRSDLSIVKLEESASKDK